MELDLNGQTAVIIGGTTGIGRAIAETMADANADVVPTSRTRDNVEDAAAAVGSDVVITTDVTDRADVRALYDEVEDVYGGLNVLVNCAGIIQDQKSVADIEADEWQSIMDVNLSGPFFAIQAALDRFEGDNRAIVNVGSMASETNLEGLAAYTVSKSGLKRLTEMVAIEVGDRGIRVNTLAPGYAKTRQNREQLENPKLKEALHGQTPLSRYAELDEIAAAALFLSSPAASFITGAFLTVDGGLALR